MNLSLVRHLGVGGMVYPWSGKVSHPIAGIEKEALNFLASFFGSSTSGMVISSPPPVGDVHQAGLPIQPNFHVVNGWLRWVTASSANVWCLSGMHCILPLGSWGNPTAPFTVHHKRTFLGFSVGPPTLKLHFQFLDSHLPLQPMSTGGPGASVQRLALGATSIVATGA